MPYTSVGAPVGVQIRPKPLKSLLTRFLAQYTPFLMSLLLTIRHIGPVPSFKNSKMLTRGKLITDPKKQKWMKAAQDSFESQLLSKYPTTENETVTAAKLRSWIASVMPERDSCRFLTQCSWRFMPVPKKLTGATLLIERL